MVNLFPQLNGPPPLNKTILPENLTFSLPSLVSAYDLVLAAETEAVKRYRLTQSQLKADMDAAAKNVVDSRVVGFLFPALWNMRHSLGDQPLSRLVLEVVSTSIRPTEIYYLGRRYIDHLIGSFRTTTVPPTPSNHPSRPSRDELEDMLYDVIQESSTGHSSARARVLALARDGYRCMVTNTIDANSFYKHQAIKELQSKTDAAITDVQTCHIFNESVLQTLEPDDKDGQRGNASGAIAILDMFGLKHLATQLSTIAPGDTASASGVHVLLNILSLQINLHRAFDLLKFALEPVADRPNTYDVIFVHPQSAIGLHGLKDRVTLTNFADTHQHNFKRAGGLVDLPLPDPRLLALHAVCVRVAHMSGAAQALDDLDRDVENTFVLASDGASANLLYSKLSPLVTVIENGRSCEDDTRGVLVHKNHCTSLDPSVFDTNEQ